MADFVATERTAVEPFDVPWLWDWQDLKPTVINFVYHIAAPVD